MITQESLEQNPERSQRLQKITQLSEIESLLLVDRHGAEAEEFILRYGAQLSYWQYEALHAIDHTMCLHLVDFYSRRTPLILSYPDHGESVLTQILPFFESRLNWSKQETAQQVSRLKSHIARELSWRATLAP